MVVDRERDVKLLSNCAVLSHMTRTDTEPKTALDLIWANLFANNSQASGQSLNLCKVYNRIIFNPVRHPPDLYTLSAVQTPTLRTNVRHRYTSSP